MGFMLCKCWHLGSRHGIDPPVMKDSKVAATVVCYPYNCADCDCKRFDPVPEEKHEA